MRKPFVLVAALLSVGFVADASAETVVRERFELKGNYKGEINGQFDLGSLVLEVNHESASRIRENIVVDITAHLKDPRTKDVHEFRITAGYSIMRDLVQLTAFNVTKGGQNYQVAPEDEDEMRMVRAYLPFMYLSRVFESGTSDSSRYTVVPGKGEGANYLHLDRIGKSGSNYQVALVQHESDASSGVDTAVQKIRYNVVSTGAGGKILQNLWILVMDRPSKYLDIEMKTQDPS